MLSSLKSHLPPALQAWFTEVSMLLQVVTIVLAAGLLRWLLRRIVDKLTRRYDLPLQVVVSARRVGGFLIGFGALLLVLRVFGVSGAVLWTAFTGFAAVAAVAFFAAWSVLTNIFCALLILITRPFRLHDHIELVESGDKVGLKGQVIDMNLIFVTLEESHPNGGESTLRVPNSLFFQRATRRWRGEPVAQPVVASNGSERAPAQGGGAAINFP